MDTFAFALLLSLLAGLATTIGCFFFFAFFVKKPSLQFISFVRDIFITHEYEFEDSIGIMLNGEQCKDLSAETKTETHHQHVTFAPILKEIMDLSTEVIQRD